MDYDCSSAERDSIESILEGAQSRLFDRTLAFHRGDSQLTVVCLEHGRFYVHLYDDDVGVAQVLTEPASDQPDAAADVEGIKVFLAGRAWLSLAAAARGVRAFLWDEDLRAEQWIPEQEAEVSK